MSEKISLDSSDFRLFSFIDERGHITVAYFLYFLMN